MRLYDWSSAHTGTGASTTSTSTSTAAEGGTSTADSNNPCLAILKSHTGGVGAVDWSHDDRTMESCGKDGNVALWSVYPPA